jgi:Ser/Thr protein kinase RdoA (MazF antagonist)
VQHFAWLQPEAVLAAAEQLGLETDGRFLALNSYENRVYQVLGQLQGKPTKLVLKFYRPKRWSDEQILEDHRFSAELVEAEVPCVEPIAIGKNTLLTIQGERLMASSETLLESGGLSTSTEVTPIRFAGFKNYPGRAPDLENIEHLRWIGRFMGRIHAVGRREAFETRETLTPSLFGQESVDWLLRSELIPESLKPSWQAAANMALDLLTQRWNEISCPKIRLHGDCHAGNILWSEGPHFVDLDDSRNGPAVQDLWMLLSGDVPTRDWQLKALLEGYETLLEFDRGQLQLIEPLRTLRLLHHSAWIGRRWNDPAFPAAFPWFGSERYWQERILELREQISLLQEFQQFDLL